MVPTGITEGNEGMLNLSLPLILVLKFGVKVKITIVRK
jgi:hypothetical protein